MARKKIKPTATTTTIMDKKQVGVSLTENAVANLNAMVEKTGLSRSKLIEALATGDIAIISQSADQAISLTAPTADRLSSEADFQSLENQNELDTIINDISAIELRMKEDRLEINASIRNIDNMLALIED